MGKNKIKPKQKVFITEYLKDLNASQAALRAGYKCEASGQNLMRKKHVLAEIKKAQKERAEKAGVSADRILQELCRIGLSDPRKLFDANGTLKDPLSWDDELAPSIASIEVTELFGQVNGAKAKIGELKKVKFWDKNSALSKIADHLGMIPERGEKKKDEDTRQTILFSFGAVDPSRI